MFVRARHYDAYVPEHLTPPLFFSPLDDDCALADAIDELGFRLTVGRNQEIFSEQEPAHYFYKVVSGLVRTCRFLLDGRRQIDSFHFRGDMFGFASGVVHGLSAEAAGSCRLMAVKRQVLTEAAARDGRLATALLGAATAELRKAQEHVVLLGRNSAPERIMVFLRGLAGDNPESDMLDIPMSRQDIADYLGLTIETVSRVFTQLDETGLIELETSRRLRMHRTM